MLVLSPALLVHSYGSMHLPNKCECKHWVFIIHVLCFTASTSYISDCPVLNFVELINKYSPSRFSISVVSGN